jgi:hypothetical protein
MKFSIIALLFISGLVSASDSVQKIEIKSNRRRQSIVIKQANVEQVKVQQIKVAPVVVRRQNVVVTQQVVLRERANYIQAQPIILRERAQYVVPTQNVVVTQNEKITEKVILRERVPEVVTEKVILQEQVDHCAYGSVSQIRVAPIRARIKGY